MKNIAIATSALVFLAVFAAANIAHAQIGLDFLNLAPGAEIGDVLSRLYVYGVGVVAIAAMIMLVIGGVQYMVAGEKDPGPAKERIKNAIWGLILALTSYLILYTINPDLTRKVILKTIDINVVPPPTLGKVAERGSCKAARTPEETCATGSSTCYKSEQDCIQAFGGESGICLTSCTPPAKVAPGGVCQFSNQCVTGYFCKVAIPTNCRSAQNGEDGQCLTANCKLQ